MVHPIPRANQVIQVVQHPDTVMIESLETRRLLAVTATLNEGTLAVTGDNEANGVGIRRNETGQIVVRSGDATVGTFGYDGVSRITVSLLGGNDRLEIAQNIVKPTTITGGDGNDILNGGGGADNFNVHAGNGLQRCGDEIGR